MKYGWLSLFIFANLFFLPSAYATRRKNVSGCLVGLGARPWISANTLKISFRCNHGVGTSPFYKYATVERLQNLGRKNFVVDHGAYEIDGPMTDLELLLDYVQSDYYVVQSPEQYQRVKEMAEILNTDPEFLVLYLQHELKSAKETFGTLRVSMWSGAEKHPMDDEYEQHTVKANELSRAIARMKSRSFKTPHIMQMSTLRLSAAKAAMNPYDYFVEVVLGGN